VAGKEETYARVGRTLGKFRYFSESKKNRSVIKNYLKTVTGYSDSQVDRLIRRKKNTGRVFLKKRTQHTFPAFYQIADIVLLSEVAAAYGNPNGHAIKKICLDMYQLYQDDRFCSPTKNQHLCCFYFLNLADR